MPRISPRKMIVSGNGAEVSIDGRVIAPVGTCAQWLNDTTAIYQALRDGRWIIEAYDTETQTTREIDSRGCNALAATENVWAAFKNGIGVFGAVPDQELAALGGVGIDGRGAADEGTIAIIPDYQNGGQVDLVTGRVSVRIANHIGLCIVDDHSAIWNGGGTVGIDAPELLPTPVNIRHTFSPSGVSWWTYWAPGVGLVCHRTDGLRVGYVLARADAFNHHTMLSDDGRLLACWSTGQQERLGEAQMVNVWDLVPTDLTVHTYGTITRLGRPHCLGFFEFNRSTPSGVPYNCLVDVIQGQEVIYVMDTKGNRLASYVAAEGKGNTPQEFERVIALARRAAPTVPVIAYWPHVAAARTFQALPNADYIGVEMYWEVEETEAQYETRCVAEAERVIRAGKKVAGIPQCYTSNDLRIKDLQSVVVVYSRIVKRFGESNFPFTLGFSNRGRDFGLNVHSEVWPMWAEFFAGIPGAAVIAQISSPKPPTPPEVPHPQPDPEPVPQPPIEEEEDMAQSQEQFESLIPVAGELYTKIIEFLKLPLVDGGKKPISRDAFVREASQHARESGDRQRVDGCSATLDSMIWGVFLTNGTRPLNQVTELDHIQSMINAEVVRLRR